MTSKKCAILESTICLHNAVVNGSKFTTMTKNNTPRFTIAFLGKLNRQISEKGKIHPNLTSLFFSGQDTSAV